jgi:HEAT repeat protein
MKRRIALLVSGLVLAAAAWALYENRPMPGGPVYQGKTAREWLAEISTKNQREAMAAFREMGTNAFPMLIQALGKKDSQWDRVNQWVYPRLPSWMKSRWTRPVTAAEQQEMWSAAELVLLNVRNGRLLLPDLVRILGDKKCGSRPYTLVLVAQLAGPKDAECVPVLVDGLAEREFGTRYQVFHGLMRIGPAAKAAVPTLTTLSHDTNIDTRVLAALSLWKIDGQTNVAVAALKEALGVQGYSYMKGWAPSYLYQIDPHDRSLIPMLIVKLQGLDSNVQLGAVSMLGSYGPAAVAAVPALTNLVDSTNRELRERAVIALKEIDPETAAKYERK